MRLDFKPDFDAAAERWETFWKGERLDRPLLSITIPKDGVTPIEKPVYTAGFEGDYEAVAEQALAWGETHEFLAESIPFCILEFGADHFSALLGADLVRNPDSGNTTWCMPFVDDWDSADIRFRPDSVWWQRTVEFIRVLRAKCDGKLLISGPTLVAGLDSLAAIRGVENLLMDLVLVPEKVKSALADVCTAYKEIAEAMFVELGCDTFGSITRHGMYSRGKVNVPQCDFSCMISPEMFQEFEIPCLQFEASVLDHAEYHLDGPGAIKHVESVATVPGIEVIQWMPGAGEAEQQDWTDLHVRIDSLGKGQVIWGDEEKILSLASRLNSPQLYFIGNEVRRDGVERLIRNLRHT